MTGFAFTTVENNTKEKVEIVFCLDLSASTNGLLNDIRDNLWHLIKLSRQEFPQSDLRIGIVGFARPSFGAENNYVKVLSDISDDYDLISYNLFLLNANIEKGDQCDGSALYVALKDLHWSKDEETKKMIFIFGNSNAKMCGYDYRKACDIAVKENLPVHSIYCARGAISSKYLPMWNKIAEVTGGNFNSYLVSDRSPLEKITSDAQRIFELNNNLLDTYIPYTKEGKLNFDLMVAADENSKKMSERYFFERCYYKFSPHYKECCGKWDLVTLMKTSSPDLSTLNRNYLPEEFQKATIKELNEIVKIKIERRELLKKKMKDIFMTLNNNNSTSPIDSIILNGLSTKSKNQ